MPAKKQDKNGEDSSAATFVRLGKGRTSKAIKQIRTLRSLNNYDHTASQTRKIVDALAAEVKAVEDALTAEKGKATNADLFDF